MKPKVTFQRIITCLKEERQMKEKVGNLLGVFLFVGANGVGKTTTVAKACFLLKQSNYKVAVVAADTFRAGAETQLREKVCLEPELSDVVCYGKELGKNSATIIYQSIQFAKQTQCQFLLCDLAGRVENRSDLLQELTKVRSVVEKNLGCQPVIFFVADATHGKFCLQQVKKFQAALKATNRFSKLQNTKQKKFLKDVLFSGLVLTKTDSFSRAGFVLPIKLETKLDVLFVGNGEKITDLKTFNAKRYLLNLTS
jgi:fused signal recognition particle receptor